MDLSARAKFRLTGGDRLRYLNGQVTNDVRQASDTRALSACLLNAKGKIDAHLFIATEGDAFVLDTDAELREAIAARLERYIIADDVLVEDVTDEFALLHVTTLAADVPAGSRAVAAERFGSLGTDLWWPRGECEAALVRLSQRWPLCDVESVERLRIEQGIPRWGRELTAEILPHEANLEASCVDYAKGCYIGQEVVSRMKMSGQTSKRVVGLRSTKGQRLAAGMRLTAPGESKDVGWITSAVRSETCGAEIALGFVKRGHNSLGSPLEARGRDAANFAPVEIVPLPFGTAGSTMIASSSGAP